MSAKLVVQICTDISANARANTGTESYMMVDSRHKKCYFFRTF